MPNQINNAERAIVDSIFSVVRQVAFEVDLVSWLEFVSNVVIVDIIEFEVTANKLLHPVDRIQG